MSNFWKRFLGLGSSATTRTAGLQIENPSYSDSAAVPVTVDSALQLSAVWACVKLIAECIGSMPINVYRVDIKTGKRTLDPEHYLARLFAGKVNRWQTRNEYFESLAYQLALMGNDYSFVTRNQKKEIISLLPLMSSQMEVSLGDNNDVMYQYTDGSNVTRFSDVTCWHNKLFGNGIIGLSPLGYARDSIGIGSAAEKATKKIYKNGGKPSGVLSIDKVLSPEQRKAVKQNFAELAEGNEERLFVLEAGMQYQQVSLSPQDIELLSSRKFQIEDIARFFGVPSVLINDTSTSTTWGSGIQQIVQGFYKLGLRPYLERYESSMKSRLLLPEERPFIDIEFDFNALIRPDKFERIKMNKEAIMSAQMSPNEARIDEGESPMAGGDNLFMQQQMTPIQFLPVQGAKANDPTN